MSKYCAKRVYSGGRQVGGHSCGNPAGHGPDGKLCAKHAKELEPKAATIPLWRIPGKSAYFDMEEVPDKVMAREVGAKTFVDDRGQRHGLHAYHDHFASEIEAWRVLRHRANARLERAKETVRDGEAAVKRLDKAIAKLEGE